MEPMVVFSAGLVLYCGYIFIKETFSDFQRYRSKAVNAAGEKRSVTPVAQPAKRRAVSAGSRRAGGEAAHWQLPLKGSA